MTNQHEYYKMNENSEECAENALELGYPENCQKNEAYANATPVSDTFLGIEYPVEVND